MSKHTIIQQLVQTGLVAARGAGLTEAVRRSSRLLPRTGQLWLHDRRVKARLRAGDAASLAHFTPMVLDKEALGRVFHQAWAVLSARGEQSELGDYLEFGVYLGNTLSCMHQVLEERGLGDVRLFGFDSFEGLPKDARGDDTHELTAWRPGDFRMSEEAARAYMTEKGVDWDRTTLVKGFFEGSLTERLVEAHGIRKASVIMVDSDLYSSAKTVLAFCQPLIGDHAVILFDDWWPDTLGAARTGERRAFEEFLTAHPELTAEELEPYGPNAKVFLLSRLSGNGPKAEAPQPTGQDVLEVPATGASTRLKSTLKQVLPERMVRRVQHQLYVRAHRRELTTSKLDLSRVELIRSASLDELSDPAYLEHELLPSLGLNDEDLEDLPPWLYQYTGHGLYHWQMPNQFSKYLVDLSQQRIESYLEIGYRHGGTFVITVEYLHRFHPLKRAVALDPVASDSIEEYAASRDGVTVLQTTSQSEEFRGFLREHGPFDVVLIDGDHSEEGCRNDFELIKDHARLVAFHDIVSHEVPGVGKVWAEVKREYGEPGRYAEYADQYPELAEAGTPMFGLGVVRL